SAAAPPHLRRDGRLAAFALLLSELTAKRLADQRLRKLAAELDFPGNFERGEALAAVRDELLGRRGRAGLQDDEGLHLLALDGVRYTDRGRVHDRRVRRERLLDLARVHVEAGHDDHLLLAVDDRHVTVLVDGRDVARVEPAVPQGLRGLV